MLFENGVPHDFVYLAVNPAFEQMSGLKDVIGKKRSEVMPGFDNATQELFDYYLSVSSSGKPEALEYYVEALKTWLAVTMYFPEPGYFIILFDVITEKKLAEIALRESEQRFHMLFEKSMDGILLTHPDGRVFAANPAACRIVGKTEDEIVRAGRAGIVNTADPRLIPALQERNRTGVFQGVLTFVRSDGTVFPVEMASVLGHSMAKGAQSHIIFRDISERVRAEAAIKKTSDELRSVMESTSDVIAMMDTEYHYTLFNAAFQKEFKAIFGQDVQAGDSMPALLAHVPDDLADALIYWKRALRGESFIVSQQFGDAGLARNWYELHFSPIVDMDGKVVGAVHIVHNISERMRAESALRASEERYRLLFENMQEGFALNEVITDEHGHVVDFRTLDANRAYEGHTGTRREDVIGRTILETQPSADRRMIERYGRVALTGEPLTFEYYSRTFNRYLRINSFSPKRGQFATIFEDVSEMRKAESALRESEQKYRALFENQVFAILIFDQQTLRILDANEAMVNLYGYGREELLTELTVLDLSAQEDLTMKAIQETAQAGSSFVPMRYHRRKNNRLFPVEAAIGTFVWQGHPTGFLIIHEISERVNAELKLKESEDRFRQVADTAPVLIWMSGTDAACNFFNAHWLTYTGRTLEQELGNGWAEGIHPDDFQRCTNTYLDAFIERREFEMEYRLRRANGEYGILWDHGVPRFTPAGEFLGYIGSCVDITERVTTEEYLRASEAALSLAMDVAGLAPWDYDPVSDEFILNDRFYALFATDAAREGGYRIKTSDYGQRFIHPDDLEMVKAHTVFLPSGERNPNFSAYIEHRALLPGGDVRWVSAYTNAVFDPSDKLVSMHGVNQDISKRKQREEQIRFQANLLSEVKQAVIATDLNGRYIYWNPYAEKLFGYQQADMLGKINTDGFTSQTLIVQTAAIRSQVLAEHIWKEELQTKTSAGEALILESTTSLLFDEHEKPIGYVSVMEEISERKRAEEALQNSNQKLSQQLETIEQLQEKLRHQAIHDALTGLYNRHYLSEVLELVIIRSEREKTPLSIVMADVDFFKVINDSYGHPVGDLFLIEIANLLKKQVRGSDFVCRFGGEEFLLVLPGATMQFAMKRAEEIRQKCAEIVIDHAGKAITATISLGVATFPDQGRQGSEVIVKADQALYQSKQAGRDRVTGWIDGQMAVEQEDVDN
jgi:diguanylate cyclase (GGDEF)-like protein/PAS domain S-box-containing protein